MVRVRFAPSPTGYLHIGGARTALFNYFFARHNKGKFILRVEDTDKERSKKEYLDAILEDLKWLGIDWDDGPYFQSERFQIYQEYAKKLVDEGLTYYDGKAIILKMPQEKIKIDDVIHGEIEFDTSVLKDLVIIKSDSTPTYNFACVIDDALMEITHIIRGDDHISNTPKQIVLYQALGLKPPVFVHIPLILDKERKRLSKRTGAKPVGYYREKGYFASALLNYLALLGWSPGENKEVVSKKEIIDRFRLEDVNKAAAAFNSDKLSWINAQYIKRLSIPRLTEMLIPLITKAGYKYSDRNWLEGVVKLLQERIKTLNEFLTSARFFFEEDITYDEKSEQRHLRKEGTKENLQHLVSEFEKLNKFDAQSIETCMRSLAERLDIKAAKLIHPARVALTGTAVSPPLFETILLLGEEKTITRLNRAIKYLSNK